MSGERRFLWGLIGEKALLRLNTSLVLATAVTLSWIIAPWPLAGLMTMLAPLLMIEIAGPPRPPSSGDL
jgi:hypothetical protein